MFCPSMTGPVLWSCPWQNCFVTPSPFALPQGFPFHYFYNYYVLFCLALQILKEKPWCNCPARNEDILRRHVYSPFGCLVLKQWSLGTGIPQESYERRRKSLMSTKKTHLLENNNNSNNNHVCSSDLSDHLA